MRNSFSGNCTSKTVLSQAHGFIVVHVEHAEISPESPAPADGSLQQDSQRVSAYNYHRRPPNDLHHYFRGPQRGFQKDYTPVQWNEYFEEQEDIQVDDQTTFRIYKSKPSTEKGPVLFLLHGGGFSALTWALFSEELKQLIHCQCIAIDLRSHGDTVVEDESDLSANTLASDVGRLYKKMYEDTAPPPILLVGHSMGGAIAVHIADQRLIDTLVGVTVIDVVEGTAMEALASMQSFLRSRPTHFRSVRQAIEWSVRSGQIRNLLSARVSMPGQILNLTTGKAATNDLPIIADIESTAEAPLPSAAPSNPNSIAEEDSEDSEEKMKPPEPLPTTSNNFKWRIDLEKTEKYWPGWFEGLSEMFLNLPVPKLLLLASIDGLDRTLTVGQMQGKFQMQVLARCGHAVHEDRPYEVAEVIASFLLRNKMAEAANDFVRMMPAC